MIAVRCVCVCVFVCVCVYVQMDDKNDTKGEKMRLAFHLHSWVGLFWLQSNFRIHILSGSNKNGVEIHFKCDFGPFRIPILIQSRPC